MKDPEWLNVTQAALKICSTHADDNLATYQSVVRFTKEECNVKYTSIISCLDIYGFAVSYEFISLIVLSTNLLYFFSHAQRHPGKSQMNAQVAKTSFTNATEIWKLWESSTETL